MVFFPAFFYVSPPSSRYIDGVARYYFVYYTPLFCGRRSCPNVLLIMCKHRVHDMCTYMHSRVFILLYYRPSTLLSAKCPGICKFIFFLKNTKEICDRSVKSLPKRYTVFNRPVFTDLIRITIMHI